MKLLILLVTVATVKTSANDEDKVSIEMKRAKGCEIDINKDLANPQPLFISPGTNHFFHPIDRRGIIEMKKKAQMELFCTRGFRSPKDIKENLIKVTCSEGTKFSFKGVDYNFNQFFCRDWPNAIAQATTYKCFNESTIVDVGFMVQKRFLKVFSSCHNRKLERNYYTEYQLTPAIDGHERRVFRPAWRRGDFYPGKNVDRLFDRNQQRATIARILNSTSRAEEYVEKENSDIVIVRGHMAAMTDFITANEQRSSYYLVNTAPQWHRFNNINWLAVETSTRKLASDRKLYLKVYCGNFGITHLRDESGVKHEIFIDGTNQQIPVPMIFYKIIVNPADQSGVVIIGVNNPHLELYDILQNYIFCNDVSDQINYVKWKPEDIKRGYGYMCEVNEFLEKVPHLTGINVTRLLV